MQRWSDEELLKLQVKVDEHYDEYARWRGEVMQSFEQIERDMQELLVSRRALTDFIDSAKIDIKLLIDARHEQQTVLRFIAKASVVIATIVAAFDWVWKHIR